MTFMTLIASDVRATIYQVPSQNEALKSLAKELCFKIYRLALEIIIKTFSLLNYSSFDLNERLFKIKSYSDYLSAKSTNIFLQRRLTPFVKTSMLNRLKIKDLKHVSDLINVYFEKFESECKEKIHEWMESFLTSFAASDPDFINTCLQDSEKLQKEIQQILPRSEERKIASEGLCTTVIAKIYSILKKNPHTSLREILAEFEEGVEAEIAGLHSLYRALYDKFKQFPTNAIFFGGKDTEFHLYNLLGIKSSHAEQINGGDFHSLESIEDPIQKILNWEEGCYSLSIDVLHHDMAYFRSLGKKSITMTSTLISHCIFLRKQNGELEVVDPNIGLLEATNEDEGITLLQKLLLIYLKPNKVFCLSSRRFE